VVKKRLSQSLPNDAFEFEFRVFEVDRQADFVENFHRTADDLMRFVSEQELGIGHSQ
jgi:hypothetical protein